MQQCVKVAKTELHKRHRAGRREISCVKGKTSLEVTWRAVLITVPLLRKDTQAKGTYKGRLTVSEGWSILIMAEEHVGRLGAGEEAESFTYILTHRQQA